MIREVMIVAGEASGDLHGANLIKALKQRDPHLSFCGMGGAEMAQAGCDILFEAARISVVGFFEVATHLLDILAAQKTLRKRLETAKPALLVLIDFPDFNLLLARKAKKLGIPIFYYISPQVWAWRSGRVKTIGRLADKLGVILPFEESFYQNRGVDATYVGHPLLDSVAATLTREQYLNAIGLPDRGKLVGILPGSRIKEVKRLLPVFLEAAVRLQTKSTQQLSFVIPCATTLDKQDLLDNGVADYQRLLNLKIVADQRYEMMAACDAVIAASGTVTLELLLLGTPMVVAYKLSPLTFILGRILVRISYFSLVNLIADEMIVPELLQDEANPDRIGNEIHKLLFDDAARKKTIEDFQNVRKKLGRHGASGRTARLALALMNKKS